MSHQTSNLDYLIELTEDSIPSFINTLSSNDVQELRDYIQSIVDRDEAGLDKLFESMSMMMKFIPNFILHSLTPKYIEPSIAARITNKLTVKQALGVTTGLPIEYIGETSAYMDSRHAAEILTGLKPKVLKPVIDYVFQHHPLKALDILEYVSDSVLSVAKKNVTTAGFDKANMSSARIATLDRIQRNTTR